MVIDSFVSLNDYDQKFDKPNIGKFLKLIKKQCDNDFELYKSFNLDFKNKDNNVETIDEIIKEIDEISENLLQLLKRYPKICDKYLSIYQIAPQVVSWAKEYNYKNINANGYWTLIKIAIKLSKLTLEKYRNAKEIIIDKNLELLLDYALIAVDVVKILRQDSVDNPNSDNSLNLITSNHNYFIDLFGLLLSIDDKMVAAMYGRYCGFWLCDQARYTSMLFVTALAIASNGINTDLMHCLYNPEHRGLVLAKLIKSADISFVKMMGSLMEWRVYKYYLPSLLYWRHSLNIKELYYKHQRNWFLSAYNVKVIRIEKYIESNTNNNYKKIRCRLYQNTSEVLNNKIIIHAHGGGFIIGTPESHDVYVQNWCSQLPGCSILSVDYSVSPEVKFPFALQQLLDVYLFLNSNADEIKQDLGFKPEEFILVGDSAGGNLSMALLIVLNDINKEIEKLNLDLSNRKKLQKIIMPKAIFNLYSPYNLTLKISPSMILASCDSMISAGVMLSCFEAYLPLCNLNENCSVEVNEIKSNFISSLRIEDSIQLDNYSNNNFKNKFTEAILSPKNFYFQLMNVVQLMINNFKSIIRPKKKTKPWYLADREVLKTKLEFLKEITKNPYISPILYEDFESLKNVNLYIIALHFDPFLDDNVTMAKKWKGKVSFDVLDGLQHGFLNFMPFVDEAIKANSICIERIKHAIYS